MINPRAASAEKVGSQCLESNEKGCKSLDIIYKKILPTN